MQKKTVKKEMQVKRDLRSFMKDESGSMTKENVLKVGMGTIAALSLFSSTAQAQCGPGNNYWMAHENNNVVGYSPATGERKLIPSHVDHNSHCSY